MAKPLITPEWATALVAQVFDPGLVYRQVGWSAGQKPPAPIMNWWQNNVMQWCNYLNNFENELHTYVVPQNFYGGASLGSADLTLDSFAQIKFNARTVSIGHPRIVSNSAAFAVTDTGTIGNGNPFTGAPLAGGSCKIPLPGLSPGDEVKSIGVWIFSSPVTSEIMWSVDLKLIDQQGVVSTLGMIGRPSGINPGYSTGTVTDFVQYTMDDTGATETPITPHTLAEGETLFLQITVGLGALVFPAVDWIAFRGITVSYGH